MERMTLAQAVGEAPIPGPAYIPGEDFDPNDPDDVEAVRAVGEQTRYEHMMALERENEILKEELAARDRV